MKLTYTSFTSVLTGAALLSLSVTASAHLGNIESAQAIGFQAGVVNPSS